MKPYQLIFSLLLCLCGCSNREAKTKETVKAQALARPIDELRASLRESIFLKQIEYQDSLLALNFEKVALDTTDKINVKADNGKNILFKNYTDPKYETESYSYVLHGLEPKTGLYWIEQELWEDNKHFVIEKSNGVKHEIANIPVINMNGNWLFVKQNDCFRMFDDCPVGFTLYSLHRGRFELFLEVRLKNYYVDRGGWLPNGQLAICLKSLDSKNNKEYFYEISPKGGFYPKN